jgi:threonine synthase
VTGAASVAPPHAGGAYTGWLRCTRCGTEWPPAAAHRPCATCGAEGVNVNPSPLYDLSRLAAEAGTGRVPEAAGPGVFRYAGLLPVGPSGWISLGEGGTPLLPISRAGGAVGLPGLWWKDESRNPTWSYKDRLAAVAVTRAVQDGADTVVVSSTGNHGAAVAAYAARAGLRCVVLTLASVPPAMKTLMQSYGALVAAVAEPAGRWAIMRDAVEERGWVPMSGYVGPPSGSNPYGVDGYKTIAYELWSQLDGQLPDAIVAPVAYGDGISGLVRGFADLVDLGLASRLPRVIAAEPYGPFASVLAGGPGQVPGDGSVAFSIAATTASWQGVHALQLTGGAGMTAGNDEIMRAQATLAATEGLFPEPSSAITFAVLPALMRAGILDSGDTVVLLGTSTGLKDIGSAAERMAPVPVIEPTLAAFDQWAASAAHGTHLENAEA